MKMITFALTISALLLVTAPLPAQEESRAEVGRLHRIDMRAQHPRAYHPSIGDVVKCYLDFPIVPEQIVDNLQVTTHGRTVSVIGVVSTSKPKIVGSGQISLYLMPRQLGLTKVMIQPVIPGQKPKPVEINFLIVKERR